MRNYLVRFAFSREIVTAKNKAHAKELFVSKLRDDLNRLGLILADDDIKRITVECTA